MARATAQRPVTRPRSEYQPKVDSAEDGAEFVGSIDRPDQAESHPTMADVSDRNSPESASPDVGSEAVSERDSIVVSIETCPECDADLVTDDFETVCGGCGLVIDDMEVDLGPEWTDYGEGTQHNVRRCNGGLQTAVRHDRGLGSVIGHDSEHHSVAPRARQRLKRMRKLNGRAVFRSKSERNLAYGFGEIKRIVSGLSLGFSHRDQAAILYRRGQAAGSFVGRSLDQMAAGAVYAAVRMAKLGRLPSEIAAIARCDESKLMVGYMGLVRELQLEISPPEPVDYIPRIASQLEVSTPVEVMAERLAQQATEGGSLTGANPSGSAGACIYLASQQAGGSLTQKDVAEVTDVTVVTIRSGRDALLASDSVQVEP